MRFLNGKLILWFLSCGIFLLAATPVSAQSSIGFIENRNQWSSDIWYAASVPGGRMALTPEGFRYFFVDYGELEQLHRRSHQPDGSSHDDDLVRAQAVFVSFPGANPNVVPHPFGESQEYFNFYFGNDPARWASDVHAYSGVLYESFYPDIDLKVYASGEDIKYDLVVAPGGDPSQISIAYQGADRLSLDNGNLIVETLLGNVTERRPIAWQWIGGEKKIVACHFRLTGNVVAFDLPEGFDPCYELVIDPLLIFSTYSGSTADNWGSTATPGEHGNLYSAGVTNEQAGGVFPATPGSYQLASGGLYDIGILKYDSLGSKLLYATYIGGSNSESPHSLVMNEKEELLLLGTTSSENYPTTSTAYRTTFGGGVAEEHVVLYSAGSDIIVSRFSGDGKQLLASTYFGGAKNDGLNPSSGTLTRNYGDQLRGDILTDADGNIYVSSVTASPGLFSTPVLQSQYGGGTTDALLLKFDEELSQLLWGTYLGGTATDASHTIKLDRDNNVLIAGGTSSLDFPVTSGSYQTTFAGVVDGWVAKISEDGSKILHSTFTGTNAYDQIYFLDINDSEEVYVYGQTSGPFPVTKGVYNNPSSGQFVQKFSNDLQSLLFSTVFGAGRGIPDISPTAFLVNDCNNLYMSGWGGRVNQESGFWYSNTEGMPTTPDAVQQSTSGSDFYFIVLTEDASERLYATFLGGTQSSTHVDGGTSRFDKHGIVYHSVCAGCKGFNSAGRPTSDFPTTPGAWSETNRSNNCNNAAFKFDLSSLKARIRSNSHLRDAPGLATVCLPDALGFENFSTGGEIYHWDFGDGSTESFRDTSFVVHEYTAPGNYIVTLEAIDYGTCQVVDRASVAVHVYNAESFIQDDDDMCFGDSYQLKAGGAANYAWRSEDDSFFSDEAAPVVHPSDTTTYYLKLQETNGCYRRDTVTLNVIPGIEPQFNWARQPDCRARPEIHMVSLTDSLKNDDRLLFDFGDGVTEEGPEADHRYTKDGVFNVTLLAQREFCVYEKTVAIPVFEMFIPNVITPGQANYNDVFTIRYGAVDGVTPATYGYKVALSVYNLWGSPVYQTDDYQYDWSGDGLAPGTYYYEVTVEGHATCKNWLHLIK